MDPPCRASLACSYQRRCCDPSCIFACYFNDHRTFVSINRLFGHARAEILIRVRNVFFKSHILYIIL